MPTNTVFDSTGNKRVSLPTNTDADPTKKKKKVSMPTKIVFDHPTKRFLCLQRLFLIVLQKGFFTYKDFFDLPEKNVSLPSDPPTKRVSLPTEII